MFYREQQSRVSESVRRCANRLDKEEGFTCHVSPKTDVNKESYALDSNIASISKLKLTVT